MKKRLILDALHKSRLGRHAFDSFILALGRRALEKVEPTEDERFLRVSFRGLPRSLYWPACLGLRPLYIVTQEQAYPWNWHYYEIPETRVAPSDVVLDCGAAEGLFSLHVQDRCRSSIPIEPLPLFVECLERTFAGAPNVRVVPAALSDYEGTATLQEDGIATKIVDGARGATTRVTTVDGLCRRMGIVPTYIKADLEGSEPAMIRGARELIKRHRPRIALTTYDDPAIAAEVKAQLRAYNRDYQFRTKGRLPATGAPFMLHAW
jgi:FkbM family methyltransferase